jgi:hypothetical protein
MIQEYEHIQKLKTLLGYLFFYIKKTFKMYITYTRVESKKKIVIFLKFLRHFVPDFTLVNFTYIYMVFLM